MGSSRPVSNRKYHNMYIWLSLILHLLLEFHGFLADNPKGHGTDGRNEENTTDTKCSDITFNLTTAKCYDPKHENIDTDIMWPTKNVSQGYCYDKDGVRYTYRSSLPFCCGCIKYFCHLRSTPSGYYNFWKRNSISSYCCQDIDGFIYPPDEVMSTAILDDSCATQKTTICKSNAEWNKVMGVITESYTPRNCCLDSEGLNPVNTIKLDPSTCSIRTCRPGQPTSLWSSCPVISGENCCLLNNKTLIANGDLVQTQSGVNVKCCDGNMVVDYHIPKNCSEKDAIHSSIGFAIDNTGSVSPSSVGITALSNDLLDHIIAHDYIIPQWVLVTFNDEANVTSSTDLRIVTKDVDEFRINLNNITFSGGGDGPERATHGLWVTLSNLPNHGIALVFTDHETKDLDMESALTQIRDRKSIKIFVVLAPKYRATIGDDSWNLYKRLSEGRIYNMEDFNATQFLNEVVQVVGESCEDN